MKVSLTILSALIGAVSIGAVYEIENRHDAARAELRDLKKQVQATEREIHVLQAEWSYQARPARIQALAERHLALAPTSPDRILADSADLPNVMERLDGIIAARAGEVAE